MILRSFTPTWHPSSAQNDYRLYNDLNQTNNILYYDTTGSFINYPKVFTYKRIRNNYNFKLSKVVTNNASDDPIFNPKLPATEGTFTINKIVADSGSVSPSIDLYFNGTIQLDESEWDIDNHSYITIGNITFNPETFDTSSSTYSLDKKVTINYDVYESFDEGYELSSFQIKFTMNWGKNSSGNFISKSSSSQHSSVTLDKPTTFVPNVTPTITMWIKLYSKQSSGPEPQDYVEISQFGTIIGNTVIREEPSINAEIIASVEFDSNAYFTLRTKDSSWYYSDWDGGWVSSSRIRF